MKPKQLFNKLHHLSFTELLLLIHAWWLFLKWDLLVTFFHYKYWQLKFHTNSVKEQTNTPSKHNKPSPRILSIIRLSEKVGRHHLRQMNCLRRCLCQQQLLAKKQYFCQLHIGVKITENIVQAHSWLSYQGTLINDSQHNINQYTELEKPTQGNIFSSLKG